MMTTKVRVNLANPTEYDRALRILKCAEEVTGYREVRYPKMDAARQWVEDELAATPGVKVEVQRSALETFRTPANV